MDLQSISTSISVPGFMYYSLLTLIRVHAIQPLMDAFEAATFCQSHYIYRDVSSGIIDISNCRRQSWCGAWLVNTVIYIVVDMNTETVIVMLSVYIMI